MAVSGVTGSERALAPGVGLTLEMVRLSVNEYIVPAAHD